MNNGAARPVKVLYVAGLGRSGSTILANTLGQVEGFFSGGELNFIWKHALIENRLCGCGRPSRECPFWGPGLRRRIRRPERGAGPRDDAAAVFRRPHAPHPPDADGRREAEDKGAPRQVPGQHGTGCTGPSSPSRAAAWSSIPPRSRPTATLWAWCPGVDLRVLHLIRDPRAAAYSWAKKKRQPDSAEREFMHQKTPTQSAVLWDAWNGAIEALWRHTPENYLRLRYEDFIAEPRQSFEQILKLVGEQEASLPLEGERAVKLGISHTVSGNPNRFDTGTVELRQDRAWQKKMKPRDKALGPDAPVPYPLLRVSISPVSLQQDLRVEVLLSSPNDTEEGRSLIARHDALSPDSPSVRYVRLPTPGPSGGGDPPP